MAPPAPLTVAGAARRLLELRGAGASAFLWAALGDAGGARLLGHLGEGGELVVEGTLGGAALDRGAVALGARALAGDPAVGAGLHALGAPALDAWLEVHHPPPELVIVGAGHIAQPLAVVGALLGMAVTVLDDRPEFATRERFPDAARVARVDFSDPLAGVPLHRGSHLVLVTRGHRYDYEVLRRLLAGARQPAYVGMIGSRRRVRATFAKLVEEGVDRERLARVRAPLGLDLGAQSPAEIAVAVAAEIVLQQRGGSGRPLREVARVLERFFVADEGRGEP